MCQNGACVNWLFCLNIYMLIPLLQLYVEGHEKGYFVKNRTTGGDLEQEFGFSPYKVVSIDLSNPEASVLGFDYFWLFWIAYSIDFDNSCFWSFDNVD